MTCKLLLLSTALAVTTLLAGCDQDQVESNPDTTNKSATPAATSTQQVEQADTLFSASDQSITLVGNELSRNTILSRLTGYDQTAVIGGPIIDRVVAVEVRDGEMGEVLAQLLAGLDYQASFQARNGMRSRLQTLWIGDAALRPDAVVEQVSQPAASLASPIVTADGSLDAGESFVRKQIDQYENGDVEQKIFAVNDLELSEGGVVFLSHVIRTEQNQEVVIEAIQRLDLGEEFAARWALLDALDHPDEDVLMEVLAAIEVWRDPTIRKYLEPLSSHPSARISERARELIEDIDIYAELELDTAGATTAPSNSTEPSQ